MPPVKRWNRYRRLNHRLKAAKRKNQAGTRAAQAPPGPSPEGKGCVRGQGHEGGDAPQGPPTQG